MLGGQYRLEYTPLFDEELADAVGKKKFNKKAR